MIHDGGVVAVELSEVVVGAPQLITIGTDKTLTIGDTILLVIIYVFWIALINIVILILKT